MPDEKETEPAHCHRIIQHESRHLRPSFLYSSRRLSETGTVVLLALRILSMAATVFCLEAVLLGRRSATGLPRLVIVKDSPARTPSQYFRQLGLEFVRSYIFLGHQSHPLRCFYRSVCWSVILNQLSIRKFHSQLDSSCSSHYKSLALNVIIRI